MKTKNLISISQIACFAVGVARIRGDFIWLRGVSNDYLNCLPEWRPDDQKQDAEATRTKPVKPWHRWEASIFDSLIAEIVLIFLLAIVVPSALDFLDSSEVSDTLYGFITISSPLTPSY